VQSNNIFTTSIKYICKIQKIIVILHRKPKVCRHNLKAFTIGPHYFMQWGNLSACFGILKLGNFQPIQNKIAVNALWDMYIPPAERPLWTTLFGGISYSAWAFVAYSYRKGVPRPQNGE
jgi:hypothetical protein